MTAVESRVSRREAVIADTAHLLDGGEWPPRIATRLGYHDIAELRRSLRRWGQTKLADRLQSSNWDPDTMRHGRWA